MKLLDRIISYIYTRHFYGPRCPDFQEGCICCEAWALHDEMTE